jgi:phage terminase Nu1 subunit (DNA packaging protein)
MSVVKIANEVKDFWLNKSQMAASLNISVQAFDKWRIEPVARVGRSVYFSVADVLNNRLNNEKGKHQLKVVDPEDLEEGNIDYERYRLTKAQADAQELKNEIALGNVVPTEFAVFALTKVAAESVGILDSLPMNINRKHPEITVLQIENIKREVAKACNVIRELEQVLPELVNEFIAEAAE